jgi:hypothetical protein
VTEQLAFRKIERDSGARMPGPGMPQNQHRLINHADARLFIAMAIGSK